MSCLGDADDTSFYSASSASGELELYPPMEPLPDGWRVVEWPDLPTNPQATVSHGKYLGSSFIEWRLTCESPESVASITSCTTHINDYGQPSYTEEQWPAIGYQAEPHNPGFWGRDDSLTCTADSETSTAAQTSTSVPFNYFEDNQSWPSAGTSHTDVRPYQPSTRRWVRTELVPVKRLRPYRTFGAPANEFGNAEAGPSTEAPLPIPYVGLPALQPPGGVSETTADAIYQTDKEEEGVPMTKRTRLPRGEGRPREYRRRAQRSAERLRNLVRRYRGSRRAPSLNKALEVAVKIIPVIRELEYSEPCLIPAYETLADPPIHAATVATCRSKLANSELQRRNKERWLFQELSKYYPLREGQRGWGRPELLLLVLMDLENFLEPWLVI